MTKLKPGPGVELFAVEANTLRFGVGVIRKAKAPLTAGPISRERAGYTGHLNIDFPSASAHKTRAVRGGGNGPGNYKSSKFPSPCSLEWSSERSQVDC